MTRLKRRIALVALALAGVSCGAVLALSEDRTTGSRSLRLAAPVDVDEAAERTLRGHVAQFTTGCTRAEREPPGSAVDTIVDSTAAIKCDPKGIAKASLAVFQFTDVATANRFLDDYLHGRQVYGSCAAGVGRTRWATRAGSERGTLLCLDGAGQRLVWTDERKKTVTSLASGAAALNDLIAWWEKAYRPATPSSLIAVQTLTQKVRQVVAGARCSQSRAHSALALVAVSCRLPGRAFKGVLLLKVEQLSSPALLLLRIAAAGPAISRATGVYCGVSPLYRGPWKLGRKDRGTLLCYPGGKSQIYHWTLDSARLYLAFTLTSGDEKRAFAVWQKHLYAIGI